MSGTELERLFLPVDWGCWAARHKIDEPGQCRQKH